MIFISKIKLRFLDTYWGYFCVNDGQYYGKRIYNDVDDNNEMELYIEHEDEIILYFYSPGGSFLNSVRIPLGNYRTEYSFEVDDDLKTAVPS
jgi:hypothetical protein